MCSSVDLIVVTNVYELFLILRIYYFTKQVTPIRRSTVLSLSLQLVFSALTLDIMTLIITTHLIKDIIKTYCTMAHFIRTFRI